MDFMIKNTTPVAVVVDFGLGEQAIPPGDVAGPFEARFLDVGLDRRARAEGFTIFPAPAKSERNGSEPVEPVELEQPEAEPPPASDDDETETEPENTIE